MHYKVLKVYNNNVVLAEEPGGKQIVLIGKGVGFERIRRITGYLTGDLSSWNSAKRAEEKDRVKHL